MPPINLARRTVLAWEFHLNHVVPEDERSATEEPTSVVMSRAYIELHEEMQKMITSSLPSPEEIDGLRVKYAESYDSKYQDQEERPF